MAVNAPKQILEILSPRAESSIELSQSAKGTWQATIKAYGDDAGEIKLKLEELSKIAMMQKRKLEAEKGGE